MSTTRKSTRDVLEVRLHGRGGQGVIAMQTTERNGQLVAAAQVATTDELMLMSSNGTLVRTRASDISVLGRNTQGVRLIRLDEGERLVVTCRYLLELSEAETAVALGIPAGTVKSRLHRGLHRLRDRLEPVTGPEAVR